MIRAVIFDLGGVLVRTEDPAPRTALARRLGITRAELEAVVFSSPTSLAAQKGDLELQKHWESVRESVGLTRADEGLFQAGFWGGDRLDQDLVALLRSLRGPYRTALLSNAFANLRRFLTEEWQIADAFDQVIISAEVGLLKPDPRIYHLALERLQVAPQEAVFLDDFQENVAGAQAVGLHAIQFLNAAQARADLLHLLDQKRPSE